MSSMLHMSTQYMVDSCNSGWNTNRHSYGHRSIVPVVAVCLNVHPKTKGLESCPVELSSIRSAPKPQLGDQPKWPFSRSIQESMVCCLVRCQRLHGATCQALSVYQA